MQIPIRDLKKYLKDNTEDCKHSHSFDKSIISKSLFALFNKVINKFSNMTEYETGLFIQSCDKWLDRKDIVNTAENNLNVSVGDICMIDWNINYKPELSYVHPCLIVEDVNNMIFVIPVSASQDKLENAYHKVENPDGDQNYWKVNIEDGFLKECVLFVSEAKVVSKSRIINKIGSINCDMLDEDSLFRNIRKYMIKTYFPYEVQKYQNTIERLNEEISRIENLRRKYQSRYDVLRIKYDDLLKDIENNNN